MHCTDSSSTVLACPDRMVSFGINIIQGCALKLKSMGFSVMLIQTIDNVQMV
jgi:hypothetical protein